MAGVYVAEPGEPEQRARTLIRTARNGVSIGGVGRPLLDQVEGAFESQQTTVTEVFTLLKKIEQLSAKTYFLP